MANGVILDEKVPNSHVQIEKGKGRGQDWQFSVNEHTHAVMGWVSWDAMTLYELADAEGPGTYPVPWEEAPHPVDTDPEELAEIALRAQHMIPGGYGGRCAFGDWFDVVDTSRDYPVCAHHHERLRLVEDQLVDL